MTLDTLLALVDVNRLVLADTEFKLSQALMLLFPQMQAAPHACVKSPFQCPWATDNRENSAALMSNYARFAPAREGMR